MNILFCNSSNVSEVKGGTERITARISKGLNALGHHCFLAYKTEIDPSMPLIKFDASINVRQASLEDFILQHQIEIVIIQKMTRDVKLFYKIRNNNQLNYRIYSVLHFAPRFEEGIMNFSKAWNDLIKESHSIKDLIKNNVRLLSYPVYKFYYPKRNKELYQTVYHYSDKVVLLSKTFIPQYADFCQITDKSKFAVIPNALSYDDFLLLNKLYEKKKQVLVVSRLEEAQKRISLVIKAWAKINSNDNVNYNMWTLKIVGTGPDENYYKNLVKKLKLKNVEFCGRQEPKPYYEESAIFLMTSPKEGWGLTLTEAQQFGCVPIAFDSYSSIHDIITDGKNGLLIKDNDLNLFVRKMKKLMTSESLRIKMAQNAIRSSEQFALHKIINLWENLLK